MEPMLSSYHSRKLLQANPAAAFAQVSRGVLSFGDALDQDTLKYHEVQPDVWTSCGLTLKLTNSPMWLDGSKS